ncbi:Type 1 glutamine amidotransferase-like domain-containing protein [Clostridium sp. YIM B02515]|uniref:Type 1 glutamine amidotransferase-like domain-containing protein n=1 Tax=Clostridium rhizosphaerae TaxID=2803861 RepID=A0ABS1TEI1_9CLOT|nr:Type 1 glutamine amidotransferase-like domain-containing protein [Clostridium rhizosphaerae]MBL4937772.1 Type 1 glutamine amidotransferase-like domain-containing protein [Clostridium rhizosphaerae]
MKKILLTSAGLSESLKKLFFTQIMKKPQEIKIILVPSALTNNDGAREGLLLGIFELENMGILPENIFVYDLRYILSKNYSRMHPLNLNNIPSIFRLLSVDEMNEYDVLLFSGGNASVLLDEINRTGFNEVAIQAVDNGLFYLGVSAGSMVAAGNLPYNLGYVKNTITVHCEKGTTCGNLPQQGEIYLTNTQAIWIYGDYAQIVE